VQEKTHSNHLCMQLHNLIYRARIPQPMANPAQRPRRPKKTATRTSIAIGPEEKLVLDWWVGERGATSMSNGIRLLLEKAEKQPWPQLVDTARNSTMVCEQHNEPLLLFEPSTQRPLCRRCTTAFEVQQQVGLMRYCRRHLSGYHRYCAMCENDKTRREVPVPAISASTAVELEREGAVLVDVRRTKHVRGEFEGSRELKYTDILDARNGKLVEFLATIEPSAAMVLFDDDGEGRSYGAAGELVMRYGMENRVYVVQGGIRELRSVFPGRYQEVP